MLLEGLSMDITQRILAQDVQTLRDHAAYSYRMARRLKGLGIGEWYEGRAQAFKVSSEIIAATKKGLEGGISWKY